MVKLPNLTSAVDLAKRMDGLSPGPSLDRLMRNANDGWGFSNADGTINGRNGFWMKEGRPQVGNMDLHDFLKMSRKAQADFLNSDVFSASVRARVGNKIDASFSSDLTKSVERGAPAARAAQADFIEGGVVKSTKVSEFDALIKKFSKVMKFGVAAGATVWTVSSLLELVEQGSGCFLVGPDGQEEKVGTDCSCTEGNPNATSCCDACNSGGDQLLCPGVEWSGPDPPANYVCPSDVVPTGRARQMRATMSVAAALATQRAATLPTKPAAAKDTRVPCGCVKGGEWYLEHRQLDMFDVIGSLLASAGMMLVEVAKGVGESVWDIVEDGIGALSGPITTILIVVGVVIGAAVLAGVTVAVVKRKKRKQNIKQFI